MVRLTYDSLLETYKKKDCKLILTEEEYNKIKKISRHKYKFISSCGHENTGYIYNMNLTNAGVLCKDCQYKKISKKQRGKIKLNNGISNSSLLEYQGYTILKNIIKDKFYVEKCTDSCDSDIIIKPIEINKDKWLRIQLKTTLKPSYGLFTYKGLNKNYKNCIVLCMSLHSANYVLYNKLNPQIWIFEHNEVSHVNHLSIGIGNSKYSKNKIRIINLNNKLLDDYSKYNKLNKTDNKDRCMIPNTLFTKEEYKYRLRREKELNFINFEQSYIDNTVYNFKINNFQHQEKICTKCIKKNRYYYQASLTRRNYSDRFNYKLTDNDFYWFWIPDSTLFYVIPESVLYEYDFINEDYTLGNKAILLYPYYDEYQLMKTKNDWSSDYKFDLKNLDKDKLCDLIRLNEVKKNTKLIENKLSTKLSYGDIISLNKYVNSLKIQVRDSKFFRKPKPEPIVRIPKEDNKCIDCNKVISDDATRCVKCHTIFSRKVKDRPSKEQLQKEVDESSKKAVGRKYNVSDNCIKKWLNKK